AWPVVEIHSRTYHTSSGRIRQIVQPCPTQLHRTHARSGCFGRIAEQREGEQCRKGGKCDPRCTAITRCRPVPVPGGRWWECKFKRCRGGRASLRVLRLI